MRRTSVSLVAHIAAIVSICVSLVPMAQAQTFQVIHTFTGGQDGANPDAGLTIDNVGNLYGTASAGGSGSGTVYELKHKGAGWTLQPLYSFSGGSDGAVPLARVVFGPDGALYGTTSANNGTVFNVKPDPAACKSALCPWTESTLYSFPGGSNDGAGPSGELAFDQTGNLYGATRRGGNMSCEFLGKPIGCGTVFRLMPSNGGWTESILHFFGLSPDGYWPLGGLILDREGNVYGSTDQGGSGGAGTVFELTPMGNGWSEHILHSLGGNDGAYPAGGLIWDAAGNLYGSTADGGSGGGGTVFELSPSDGAWTLQTLYNFSYTGGPPYCGPSASLSIDTAGNLYGTTHCDGTHALGNVWELERSSGGWTYKDLYDFTGSGDGEYPSSNVVVDANGNLYGTTYAGGKTGNNCDPRLSYECGVVWEITP